MIHRPERWLAAACAAASLTAAGCASAPGDVGLTDEQACLHHFENDATERTRCHVDAAMRSGTPPDVSPKQLPLDTGQPSD